MNFLHLTDLSNGTMQLSWQHGSAVPRFYPRPIPFADPFTLADRQELRWYLEEFLSFPYGAERWRAQQLEAKMHQWGEALFSQVFVRGDSDPDPRALYQEAVREGLDKCELCISSEDPDFLNVPWELLRDPTPGRGYLALTLKGLFRQRSGHKIEVPTASVVGEPFRILLVLARPYGDRDVPLGTVARPMLEALRPFRPRVSLELLRPPSFDALQQRLNDRPGYYHLVHFDGHGVFANPARGALSHFGAMAGRGHLAFEKEDGSADIVNSQDLGQALANAHVPLFVLNACQSAEEGRADPFASVASQLIAIGAKGVVAMSYSVYAVTASRFIQRFYEHLVNHASLSEAVAGARRRLHAESGHDSVVGTLELRDWMVPTLHQQEYHFVPIPRDAGLGAAVEDDDDLAQRQAAVEVCPEGRFGFIGRDYDILRIERALRRDQHPWALLSGVGGVGKTDLSYGFARWYAETGGAPGGVFATSFKEKADFGQVVGSVVGYGTDFSRLPEKEQWQRLVGHLRGTPCLLIWDNFEPVAGYPEGAEPLAAPAAREQLARFLQALKGGRSRVLISTRKPAEDWLGIAYELLEVRGLTRREAVPLAQVILKTVGRQPADFRDDPDFARLLDLLHGHPRSLELVLPHLRTQSPTAIIESLLHRTDQLGEAMEDASLAFAFSRMSPSTRQHLPLLGLFASYVLVPTLVNFVAAGAAQEQAYAKVVGEALDQGGWARVLAEAARGGLVEDRGGGLYHLHPTLPAFLRRQLLAAAGEASLQRLDAEFLRFCAALAAHLFDEVRKADQQALALVAVEEANLLRALRLAEGQSAWAPAQSLAQTLYLYYEHRGRFDEWRALCTRLLNRLGRAAPGDSDRVKAGLWMFLLGEEAHQAMTVNDLPGAEAACRHILDYLIALDDAGMEPMIAVAYHELGRVAAERQQWLVAEELHLKAIEIRERLGLEMDAAHGYHELGIVMHKRCQLEAAEQWYLKAIEIKERLGLEMDAASSYHELGMIAQARGQLEAAEQWYQKALEIRERLGLEKDAVPDYYHLGLIDQERGQLEAAEQWHRKALGIMVRLGLEKDASPLYIQLGMIAQARGRLEAAEQWYQKALEITERLSHLPLQVKTLEALGLLAVRRGQIDQAVLRLGQAWAIDTDYHMGQVSPSIANILAILLKRMDEAEFTAAWRQHFPDQAPPLEAIRQALVALEKEGD